MRIAALLIQGHEYLNYKTEIMNFGGRYVYSSSVDPYGDEVIIRKKNERFFEGFFNVSDSNIKIENVSAIVGQNGVGKSTILDVIRSAYIENEAALPRTKFFMLIENDEELLYDSIGFDNIYIKTIDGKVELKRVPKQVMQSIYYSPHLDLRFNSNFDEVDYYDISSDKYLELDLVDVNIRGKNDHGISYPIKQELLFKNSLRQIQFLTSSLVTKNNPFKGLFDLPDHGEATLEFRDINNDADLRNIPIAFLTPIQQLEKKIDSELNLWTEIRTFDKKHKVTNQIDVDRFLLKRHLLKYLLSILKRQMDISGTYRGEGKFNNEVFAAHLNTEDARFVFTMFLTNAFITTAKGKENPFDTDLINSLLDRIYSVIDNITIPHSITSTKIIVSGADAASILELHKNVLFDISDYYNKQLKENSKDYSNLNFLVQGFVYYSPSKKKLSSGENALLNLFSKLYDFLQVRLATKTNPKRNFKTFVLLLDEADLGFHPVWKKKYVNALVRTLPYFFEEYEQLPTIQIIFTTHDPLTLSDLPNDNVVYLLKDEDTVRIPKIEFPNKTFGANITDLLADSFFIDDGLIGDFAKDKIRQVIEWLKSKQMENSDDYRRIIKLIDEPIVKRKLAEMYDQKMNENLQISIIEQQIEELNRLKESLK